MLTLSDCLPILTSWLLPICSLIRPCSLSILLRSLKLAACLLSHQQTHCLPILTLSDSLHQARCLCIHTIRLAAYVFTHYQARYHLFSSVRLTFYLFSHSCCYGLSVLTPNAINCTLAHHCTRALSGSLPIYSCTTCLVPHPVPTIKLAAYLTLVYCLATARLTI